MSPDTESQFNQLVDHLSSMGPIQVDFLHANLADHVEGVELPDEPAVNLMAETVLEGLTMRVKAHVEATSPQGLVFAGGYVDYHSDSQWADYSEAARKAFAERTGIPALVPVLRAAVLDMAARLSLELPQLGLYKAPTFKLEEIVEPPAVVQVTVEVKDQAASTIDGRDQTGQDEAQE